MAHTICQIARRAILNHNKSLLRISTAAVSTLNDAYLHEFFLNEKRQLDMQRSMQRRALPPIQFDSLQSLYKSWIDAPNADEKEQIRKNLVKQLLPLPNCVDDRAPEGEEKNAKVLFQTPGDLPKYNFEPRSATELGRALRMLRTDLNIFSVDRAYSFLGPLADLHDALLTYALSTLKQVGFQLVSVPDILPASNIEDCGFSTSGERTMVYRLRRVRTDGKLTDSDSMLEVRQDPLCLSGTSEMALASYLAGRSFTADKLPLYLCAASRCFRHEVSTQEDRLYRVHEFTKVEMYAVTRGDLAESDSAHQRILEIERRFFDSLGLHIRVLDMPSHELGASAARKFDIEAWLPGQRRWGELSSASNCTDYQAGRLDATFSQQSSPNTRNLVHTLNGTACALPRLLIALLETHQNRDASVNIPAVLQPFMREPRSQLRASLVPPMRIIPIATVPKNVAQLIETAERLRRRDSGHGNGHAEGQDHESASSSSESDEETARRLLRVSERKRKRPVEGDGDSKTGKR